MLTGLLVGCMCGLVLPVFTPFGLGTMLGGGFLGALLGGVEALILPLLGILTIPFGILTIPCGEAIEGMCIGLGDMMSGCCGALAI